MFAYDTRDRLLSRTDPDGRFIRYTYDVAGNRTAVITASNTNRFTFDALNRLQTVTDPDGGVTRYTYDGANNVVLMQLPNGAIRTNAYDDVGRLTYLEHRGPTDVIASYRYTLGPTGNRVAVQEDTGRTVQYVYDQLYRLTRESITDTVAGNRAIDYMMDAVGNRLTRADSFEGATGYSYDDNDQLLSESLGGAVTGYTYDSNGNTLSRSNAVDRAVYGWNPENRLTTANVSGPNGSHQLAYQYDDDGIRVAAVVDGDETRYLIDANRSYAQVVEEWTSLNSQPATLTTSYTHGPHHLISQSRAGARSWYHADGLGSTRALTGQSGSPTDRYHFDAYGRTLAQSGPRDNSYLFAGEQRDRNLGLDYLRARYYGPSIGILFGRDPLVGNPRAPSTINAFTYAGGNPIERTDPSGQQFLIEIAVSPQLMPTSTPHTTAACLTAFLAR